MRTISVGLGTTQSGICHGGRFAKGSTHQVSNPGYFAVTGYPEIKTFIEKYIEGTDELPLDELPLKEKLQQVGFSLDIETGKISEIKPVAQSQMQLRKQWVNQ